ncbi:MAG: DUF3098 domain-containing protein [Chloroflexota bacterium]
MAKSVRPAVRTTTAKTQKAPKWRFPLRRENFIWMAIGLGVILLGYALMATGVTEEPAVPQGKWNNFFAVTLSPIVLVIGYCGVIPYAILKYFGKKEDEIK